MNESQRAMIAGWRPARGHVATQRYGGDTNGAKMQAYVTKESFARKRIASTTYSPEFRAWHLGYIA